MLWEYLESNWIYYLFLLLHRNVLCTPQMVTFIRVFYNNFCAYFQKIRDPCLMHLYIPNI